MTARARRVYPRQFDDGFRGTIALLVSLPPLAIAITVQLLGEGISLAPIIIGAGLSLSLFAAVYLIWTHRLFSGTADDRLKTIGAVQHRQPISGLQSMMGFGGPENWAASAAGTALIMAFAASVVWNIDRSFWLPVIAVVTAGLSWALMAYSFALKYFRQHAAGERIDFDIAEQPVFTDFVSMAVMISSAAAMTAATPRTRSVLDTVRTHTFIAFAFNSLVLATTVSLVVGLLGFA